MNAVNFSPCGDLIVSGSDDLQVAIWDWCKDQAEPMITYDSGHSSNVFQVSKAYDLILGFYPFTRLLDG